MSVPTVNFLPLAANLANTVSAKDSPEKIKNAASQFEALLIGQILKSAQQGQSQGWTLGEDDDQAASSAMEFANDYFARALASRGGFGLTPMITKGLAKSAASSPSPETPSLGLADKPPAGR